MGLLSSGRKKEILTNLNKDWEKWDKISNTIWQPSESLSSKIDYSEPLWETFATAIPVDINKPAVRACVAFYKNPCEFKRKTKGKGCTHCALSIKNKDLTNVNPEYQIISFKNAIDNIISQLGYTPQIIEILPDGSFLNEAEISVDTKKGIFDYVRLNKDVLKIAIESRVEYITVEKIQKLLNLLRSDQILEIYVGLESIDDFVTTKIIKKGLTLNKYEKLISLLGKTLSTQEKKRLHLSVYHFFKPPYISETESIQAAISMAKKIKDYEKQIGIKFFVKYEPAIISEGTFHKYLFDLGKFISPNYFSVAEVIASSYYYDFSDKIKFGQRDDIDDFQRVSNVPHLNDKYLFSPFDFLVYNAVQRFNADQDIWGFCADLSLVFEKSKEFKNWEKTIYKDSKSFLSKLFMKYSNLNFKDKYISRIEFQKQIWDILNTLEYGNNTFLILDSDEKTLTSFKSKISNYFTSKNIKVLQLKNFKLVSTDQTTYYKKFFQGEIVIENEGGLPQSIWFGIPINLEIGY